MIKTITKVGNSQGIIFDAAFDRLRRALVSWSDPRQDIPLSFS